VDFYLIPLSPFSQERRGKGGKRIKSLPLGGGILGEVMSREKSK
jgi:hypothetical protein